MGRDWFGVEHPSKDRKADLEQRGRILALAMERAQARDLGLEQAAKLVESHDVHGGYLLREIAAGIRRLKAVP